MKITCREIKLYGEKAVKCAGGCGRRLVRTKKFYQTLNPFNKKMDGTVKDVDDIHQELKAAIQRWKTEKETCRHCQEPTP